MFLIIELLFIILLALILFMLYGKEKLLAKSALPRAAVEEYWGEKERRLHVRLKKALEVNYSVEKAPHLKNTCKSIDISMGGMKLLVDEKLAAGSVLDLKITLPGSKRTAEVEGEVVWCEELEQLDPSGKRLFHTGIKFSSIKNPYVNPMIDYICSLGTYAEG